MIGELNQKDYSREFRRVGLDGKQDGVNDAALSIVSEAEITRNQRSPPDPTNLAYCLGRVNVPFWKELMLPYMHYLDATREIDVESQASRSWQRPRVRVQFESQTAVSQGASQN